MCSITEEIMYIYRTNFDAIMFLNHTIEYLFPRIELNSKNKKEYELRFYERETCNDVLDILMGDLTLDVENVLFSYQMTLLNTRRYFKHNKKRLIFLRKMERVIRSLKQEIIMYRGEQMYRFE